MGEHQTTVVGSRRITFVEALGKGGFGAVYLADIQGRGNFAQRLAVKVLNEELSQDADVVGRQRDEARLLAQLNHDHIVKVFDLLEIGGRPAVFMEYVPGVDAHRLLREGPLPPRAALEAIAATASALHAAANTISPFTARPLNVIHRDIKPANMLVSEHGTVKVLDFGIARADFDREGKTRSVQFGTARYMAPEKWRGENLSGAVDVYALGVTLMELISGRPAHRLPLREDLFNAKRDAQIAALRDPRWGRIWWQKLEALLQDMLAVDPAGRPSPEQVQDACVELSESVGGESLRRYARRHVPGLIEVRRRTMKGASLMPSADLPLTSDPDPSILTASKSHPRTRIAPLPTVFGVSWWTQAVLAAGLVASFWWFVTG
ncbi:MAG: serine/threonine-protein kinase [Myxococcota bacterium]|nr:serine/threonine-protein kinase [Myxococcota bacterium]